MMCTEQAQNHCASTVLSAGIRELRVWLYTSDVFVQSYGTVADQGSARSILNGEQTVPR
jgi:hypothetical protein